MVTPRVHRPYRVVDYDPRWKRQYKTLAAKLQKIFGDELLAIEHVGSTSIHGMSAKPQIDILIVVRDIKEIAKYHDMMRSKGYVVMGDYTKVAGECFGLDAKDGHRRATIHVVQEGNEEIGIQRSFRDYLKCHKTDAKAYVDLKKKLYANHPDDYRAYGRGKKKLLLQILKRARKWADKKQKK